MLRLFIRRVVWYLALRTSCAHGSHHWC